MSEQATRRYARPKDPAAVGNVSETLHRLLDRNYGDSVCRHAKEIAAETDEGPHTVAHVLRRMRDGEVVTPRLTISEWSTASGGTIKWQIQRRGEEGR